MKKLGLVGGISWVSTMDYYQFINEGINKKLGGLNFAECIIYSLNFDDFQTKVAARETFEKIAKDLAEYASTLTEADLNSSNDKINEPRWQILLHIINHGTDHRSTVLQRLHEFGAPTFDQDFIMWLWSRK